MYNYLRDNYPVEGTTRQPSARLTYVTGFLRYYTIPGTLVRVPWRIVLPTPHRLFYIVFFFLNGIAQLKVMVCTQQNVVDVPYAVC